MSLSIPTACEPSSARDTPTSLLIIQDDINCTLEEVITGAVQQILLENVPVHASESTTCDEVVSESGHSTQSTNGTSIMADDTVSMPEPEPTDEEHMTDVWKNQDTHVFVLSQSGKPIYSRHGDEYRLATLMGVMQAMVSFVASNNDQIRSFISGDRKFVFLVREYLILVCVSRTRESTFQLQLCLNYLYHQIISVLTYSSMKAQFERRRNLDLRRSLNGAERFMDGIVTYMHEEIGPYLNAVRCLPLLAHMREQVATSMAQGVKSKSKLMDEDLVFAILLAGDQLVSVVRLKRFYPHSMDLHLLINWVRSSKSFKNAQQWFPICLPKFDMDGYLYAYISYLHNNTCLVLLTVDNSKFYTLKDCKEKIAERMSQSGCLQLVEDSYVQCTQATGTSSHYTGVALPVGVRHFVYKYKSVAQYTACPYPREPGSPMAENIRNYYLQLNSLLHNEAGKSQKIVYLSDSVASYFAAVDDQCEIYVTFEPLVTKPVAVQAIAKLQKMIHSDKNRLFILSSPTF